MNNLVKILQPESPPKVPMKSYTAPTCDVDEVRKGPLTQIAE